FNPFFTVTRKSRSQGQTTCAELDSLCNGTRGEAKGAGVAPELEPDVSMSLSWSIEGIDPSVRERAEAAARRAGMSLNDWLNSTIGDSTPPNFGIPMQSSPSREARDVADIHQRLDSITRQIEQLSRPAARSDAPL